MAVNGGIFAISKEGISFGKKRGEKKFWKKKSEFELTAVTIKEL